MRLFTTPKYRWEIRRFHSDGAYLRFCAYWWNHAEPNDCIVNTYLNPSGRGWVIVLRLQEDSVPNAS